MNLLDIFIIYLACGAPFGVYYFLQNRTKSDIGWLWLKTFFNFFFWIPAAVVLLLRQSSFFKIFSIPENSKFDKTATADSKQTANLCSIQKSIEKVLLESKLHISIYEFRETIERYVGLTLAIQIENEKPSEQDKELFRAARVKNTELGSICLKRRNRKRLSLHQTEARKDFLYLLKQSVEFVLDKDKLQQPVIELIKLLKDLEAQEELKKIFTGSTQTDKRLNVQKPEKDIWKPEIHILSPAKQISSRIQIMKATANLPRKD